MYCVKCKKKTETIDIIQVTTKNNRSVLKGICSVCGSKKSSFIRSAVGKGFSLNSFVNNLPIELHLLLRQEKMFQEGLLIISKNILTVVLVQNMSKGERRIQRNKRARQNVQMQDKFYNENTDTKTRNISDVALAHRPDEIARNPMYDHAQRKDANFISGIMKAKAKYGLGITKQSSKNLKRGPMAAQERNKQ